MCPSRPCLPECVERLECYKCKKQLCHTHESHDQVRYIEGHYRTPSGNVCLACGEGDSWVQHTRTP